MFEDLTRYAYKTFRHFPGRVSPWSGGSFPSFHPAGLPQNPQDLVWIKCRLGAPYQTGNFRNTHPCHSLDFCAFSAFSWKLSQNLANALKRLLKKIAMSNTCMAKIKASLLMTVQSWFFPTPLQFTHPHSNHFHAVSSISLATYQHHPTSMSDTSLKFTQPVKDSCTTRRCSSAARAA